MHLNPEAPMKHTLVIIAAFIFLVVFQSCNDDPSGMTPGDASGRLISASSCKQTASGSGPSVQGADESAVEYSYNPATRVLTLRHINAAFNCCPGPLSASVRVEDNLITISEKETKPSCDCNCLYDLDIEVFNLAQSSWSLVFVEPYLSTPDLPLAFSVDLKKQSSGRFAVPRIRYPWGG